MDGYVADATEADDPLLRVMVRALGNLPRFWGGKQFAAKNARAPLTELTCSEVNPCP